MDDDFHQYGGSSIQAARILARLFAAIRVRVPFERFMANATPAGVARLIENELGEAIANDIARAWSERRATGSAEAEARYSAVVVRAGLDVALELPATDRMPSFGQNSLWFFQRMRPDSATYNLAYAYRLRGPLRIDALRAALRDVVAANEALRSAFAEEHGQLCVTVTPEHACAFEVPVQAIADEQIQAFVDELARRPFDLAAAPLFRASIGTVGPEDNVVVLVVHHIVFDGWSRQLLLGQIAGSYWRRMRGDQESGIPASSSPTAFAELQRRWMNSNEGSSALAFWRQKLDNIRVPISIPTDYPRPEIHTHGGRKVSQRLDRELSARIDIFARELDSTPFATLLAAFKLLLKAKGVEDLIVGVPFVNREHPELESTIGYFVNMVAVRTEYEDSQSAAAVIAVETNAVNQAISRGSYPFDRLVSDLAVPRSLACNPVFQVVFNLLGDEWDRLSLFGIDAEGITVDNGGSQVDLSIAARRDSSGYTLTWEYCDALFAASTITAWQQEYVSILRALSADAATTVASAVAGVRRFAAEQQNKSNEAARSSRIDRLRKRSTTMLPGQAIARGALHRREINRAAVTVEQQVFDDIGFVKIEPSVRGLDPVAWAAEHTTALRGKLIECGGILFRGFDIHGDVAFRDFFHAVCGELNEYAHRVTKRTQVGDSFVYTSTDHPKTLDLSLHNETSYTKRWPAQIGFYCDVPSKEGGQTPIADSRKVLAALPEDLVTRFSERQLLYVRNSGNSIELPWQETFQTQSRLDVERYCKSQEMAFEWKPDGQLRTLQRCHVLARHPTTGDAVWFNQAHLMHRSAYPPGVIERMFAATADEDLPFNVFFGDRTPISDADIANINDSYQRNARCFDWQRGDVMILDNMLIAHGRRPFDGERRILVAMSGTITASDGALAPAERH
jgi:alpha-ketoglutarate-dependent taurine dioxygenase